MNGTERMNGSTFTNQTEKLWPYSLAISATILSVDLVIALVGVLGNILVCVVITKRANMKTSMNLYLRNLAITDLGVLLFIFPLAAKSVRSSSDGWVLGRFVCLYIYPAQDIFFGASIWSITVIAIERYKNIISRKVFVKKVESFKRVTLKIVLIWLIAFAVVAAPLYPLYVYRRYAENHSIYVCYPEWPTFMNNFMLKAYALCLVIFWYLLPLGIITITYWKISNQLRQSNTFHKTMHGEDTVKSKLFKEEEKRRLKQNKKAQRILTPLVVIFAVTMLPFNVLRTVHAFVTEIDLRMKHYLLFVDLSLLCLVINSSIDPIVYYLCSKEFRVGIKALFFKKAGNFKSRDTTIDSHIHDKATTRRSLVTAEVTTQAEESPM